MPAFIAVRLVLRSGDGRRYGLAVAGRTLTAVRGRPASVLLPGLPPGRRYVARPRGAARNGVAILPTAEPGP